MDNKKIGAFIKSLRLSADLSQEELAQKIPIGRSAVSKWETGKTIPDSGTLLILSKIFNVSTNELLLGEKITSAHMTNINLKLYDDRNKFKSRCNLVIKLLLILITGFLLYFFITFYKSVKVYDISSNSNEIIVDGLLVKTKSKIELKLNTELKKDFTFLSLIYKENNEERNIITSDNHILTIKDYLGYEEYIDFKKFNIIINNMYLKIFYADDSSEEFKLNLGLSYKNTELIPEKNKKVTSPITNKAVDTKTYFDINSLKNKICKNNNCNKSLNYKGKKYKIRMLEDSKSIEIKYTEKNFTIKLEYIFLNENLFIYTKSENNIIVDEYTYNLDSESCEIGKCDTFKENYEIFNNIIKKLEK